MENIKASYEDNLKATELRLGLPGTEEQQSSQSSNNKRSSPEENIPTQHTSEENPPVSK